MSSGPGAVELVALLIAGVMLVLGITGLVLFIVGLVRKRVGMWVTGLVMGVVVLMLLLVLGAAAFWVATPTSVATPPRARAMPTIPGPDDNLIEANTPAEANTPPRAAP